MSGTYIYQGRERRVLTLSLQPKDVPKAHKPYLLPYYRTGGSRRKFPTPSKFEGKVGTEAQTFLVQLRRAA